MLSRRQLLQVAAGAVVATGCASDQDGGPEAGRSDEPERKPVTVVPPPASVIRTSWSTDPFALGSYTYLPVGATPALRETLREPVADRLWFAGEAVDEAAPATVHGALASGLAAATAAIDAGREGEEVIVVGAGIAGAAAARALADAGRTVIVVEARDRTGGRLDTLRPDGWSAPIERGANWVHDVEASDLAERLAALDIDAVPFAYEAVVLDANGLVVEDPDERADGVLGAIDDAVAWAEDLENDRSLAEAIDGSGASDALDPTVLATVLRSELSTEYGADANELSAWWGTSEGTDGDDLLVIGGYGALVEDLLSGLDVRLSTPVTTIGGDGDEVRVVTATGELIAARVIVTVPIGVLQAGTITFAPPLPSAHQRAIDRLAMGLLDKIWFRWDEPWWTDKHEQWTLADPNAELVEWVNLRPATGEPILLALIGGAEARAWSQATDADLVRAAVSTLQRFADAGW